MVEDKFNQIKYQNDYKRKNYDRMELLVPKGEKAEIKEIAKSLGKSVNEFVYSAVKNEIENLNRIQHDHS